jgi:hypothetical protein
MLNLMLDKHKRLHAMRPSPSLGAQMNSPYFMLGSTTRGVLKALDSLGERG